MSNLSETTAANYNWDNGIYQVETTDPVQGGADGIANRQAAGLANRTRNLHDRTLKVESNLSDVESGKTVLSVIRGGIADDLNTLEKLRASLITTINSMVGAGISAEEVYATIRGGVSDAYDTLKELYDFVNTLSTTTYSRLDSSLKSKATVTATIDLSAAAIGSITLTANTAFTFTGFQLNKSYLLIINANGYTPSFAASAKHVAVVGNIDFATTGTFYVSLTCIDATSGSEKLLTVIMKGA